VGVGPEHLLVRSGTSGFLVEGMSRGLTGEKLSLYVLRAGGDVAPEEVLALDLDV
jgi:hypothetical protein